MPKQMGLRACDVATLTAAAREAKEAGLEPDAAWLAAVGRHAFIDEAALEGYREHVQGEVFGEAVPQVDAPTEEKPKRVRTKK